MAMAISARKLAACRANWKQWRGFTPDGIKRLRRAARRNRPWEYSTGPRTPEGKRRSRVNAVLDGEYCLVVEPDATANALRRAIQSAVQQAVQEIERGRFPEDFIVPDGDVLTRRLFDELSLPSASIGPEAGALYSLVGLLRDATREALEPDAAVVLVAVAREAECAVNGICLELSRYVLLPGGQGWRRWRRIGPAGPSQTGADRRRRCRL